MKIMKMKAHLLVGFKYSLDSSPNLSVKYSGWILSSAMAKLFWITSYSCEAAILFAAITDELRDEIVFA